MSMKRMAAISTVGSIGFGSNQTATTATNPPSNTTASNPATTNATNFLYYNITASGGYPPINVGGSGGVVGWEKGSGAVGGNHYPPHHHYSANMRSTSTNVNLMLGGAMLSVVITMLCFVCYCCHRSIRKRAASASAYQRQQEQPQQQRWLNAADGDDLSANNMEIYSVEQCYETAGLFADHLGIPMEPSSPQIQRNGPPPPSYDTVLAMDEFIMKAAAATCCHRRQRLLQRGRARQPNKIITTSATDMGDIDAAGASPMEDPIKDYSCVVYDELPTTTATVYYERYNDGTAADDVLCCCEQYETFLRECGRCGRRRGFPVTADTPATSSADLLFGQSVAETGGRGGGAMEVNGNVICVQDYERDDAENNNNVVERMVTETTPSDGEIDLNRNNVVAVASTSTAATLRNVNLDTVYEANGLVRMDMSQIIDRTGLPTYEAALKLEASGYV